jgi:Serine hydrolase (FSH1)
MNGAGLRAHIGPLSERIAQCAELVFPDAPGLCPEANVNSLYARWNVPPPDPPHRSWWDVQDEGSVYAGWDRTMHSLRPLFDGAVACVLGFSQGAIVAAALAAMAEQGQFPTLRSVVLVAGRKPRALTLQSFLNRRIALPSLHICGARDTETIPLSSELAKCFEPSTRRIVSWPGPHAVPRNGAAADAIVRFVGEQAC